MIVKITGNVPRFSICTVQSKPKLVVAPELIIFDIYSYHCPEVWVESSSKFVAVAKNNVKNCSKL